MANRGTWKLVVGTDTLADYPDVVKREGIDGGPLIQEESLAGGLSMVFFERGNFKATRTFTLTKEFANNKLSADWFETAAQTFNGVKDVKITHMDYSGTETTYKITAANVRVSAEEPIGVTVISKVTVSGAKAILQP